MQETEGQAQTHKCRCKTYKTFIEWIADVWCNDILKVAHHTESVSTEVQRLRQKTEDVLQGPDLFGEERV